MKSKEILIAIEERDRWQARVDRTLAKIRLHETEIRQLKGHLKAYKEQADYYNYLIRDMKKATRPSKIKDLL